MREFLLQKDKKKTESSIESFFLNFKPINYLHFWPRDNPLQAHKEDVIIWKYERYDMHIAQNKY